MMNFCSNDLAWEKMHNLLPVIVQDNVTAMVLMLGYMNPEALQQTLETGWVTFYSRSKNKLWIKGETSGNKLKLCNIVKDCDSDALLVLVEPLGPTCHQGSVSCFMKDGNADWTFVKQLEATIVERKQTRIESSYTSSLFKAGVSKIAQKVGEEAVEVALASLDKNDAEFCGEVADLLFHLLILLQARSLNISNVIEILRARSIKK